MLRFTTVYYLKFQTIAHVFTIHNFVVKRSYYKLAKIYHPDRVASHEKEVAKEKFNIIHNAYSILSDATKKKQYDSGSDVLFTRATVAAMWENYLKPLDNSEIDYARKKYQGSASERKDVIHEFVAGKGSMTHLLNNIPFMRVEDENRIIELIRDLIENGSVLKIPIKKIKK